MTALRARGDYVAMIGDGVNDVLSLKKADLAIAMASGSQATRGVADIILTNDSFGSLAPAVEEGQRILNGMFAILSLFLARIATMGLIIVSSLVIGVFPLDVRGGSVITLFSVGIPAVLLALWAQPGRVPEEGVARTIVRFVVPAAGLTSLVGLAVLYGSLALEVAERSPAGKLAGAELDAVVAAATPFAQSSLTTFLVMAGLMLIVFVEPPLAWFAVVRARTSDWRPTAMAIGLALAYIAIVAIAAAQDPLQPPAAGPSRRGCRRSGDRGLAGDPAARLEVPGRGAVHRRLSRRRGGRRLTASRRRHLRPDSRRPC